MAVSWMARPRLAEKQCFCSPTDTGMPVIIAMVIIAVVMIAVVIIAISNNSYGTLKGVPTVKSPKGHF